MHLFCDSFIKLCKVKVRFKRVLRLNHSDYRRVWFFGLQWTSFARILFKFSFWFYANHILLSLINKVEYYILSFECTLFFGHIFRHFPKSLCSGVRSLLIFLDELEFKSPCSLLFFLWSCNYNSDIWLHRNFACKFV